MRREISEDAFSLLKDYLLKDESSDLFKYCGLFLGMPEDWCAEK
jgi:hypothetical protein